ncbi:MAG TPA: hypothetical protein VMG37_02195 [Solirubrobacteraceae bacterium]|nr:hypothetical protein [Solirubrobacteraceae bacterium]
MSVALLASLVLLLGVAWVAGAHPYANGARAAEVRQVNSQIVASFRAFRRPRTRADALPTNLSSLGLCGGEGPRSYAWCAVDHPEQCAESTCTADAANGWRLLIYGHVHALEVADSRRVPLPDGLGAIWLIPSGRWLCAVQNGPRFRNYYVRMECGTIDLILRRPPLDFPGYFFGPAAHGIMMGAEPDEVTSAVITYPGGTETAVLRGGALAACVGRGPYELDQTTAPGVHLKPIRLGAYGSFKPVSCPALHFDNR